MLSSSLIIEFLRGHHDAESHACSTSSAHAVGLPVVSCFPSIAHNPRSSDTASRPSRTHQRPPIRRSGGPERRHLSDLPSTTRTSADSRNRATLQTHLCDRDTRRRDAGRSLTALSTNSQSHGPHARHMRTRKTLLATAEVEVLGMILITETHFDRRASRLVYVQTTPSLPRST